MMKDTEEFLQFTDSVACRECTMPRYEKSSDPKESSRKLQAKMDRVERLSARLVRLQSPPTAVVLLRFCLGRCQNTDHARTMLPSNLPPPLYPKSAGRPSRTASAKSSNSSGVALGTGLDRKSGFGISVPVLHCPAAFLGLEQQQNNPLQQPPVPNSRPRRVRCRDAIQTQHERRYDLKTKWWGHAPNATCPICATLTLQSL